MKHHAWGQVVEKWEWFHFFRFPASPWKKANCPHFFVQELIPLISIGLLLAAFGGELDVSHGPTQADEKPTQQVTATPEVLRRGKAVYERYCWPCHGLDGAGDGPVADTLNPRPRDFTQAHFKLRSTGFGELPTDADLFRTISRGIPGTAMPSWRHRLSEDERWAVLHYIKAFSPKFKGAHPQPVHIGKEPPQTPESIARGKALFHGKGECVNCHGKNGRGNGEFVQVGGILEDARGDPVFPRNLTAPWRYKGGFTVRQIAQRLATGLDGTPMSPPMAPLDELTERERWDLAHYVHSLQRPKQGRGQAVIRAARVKGELPLDPRARIWKSVPEVDVEMTGQVHVAPRNENPTVDLVRVKALYNARELALWLQWDDRIENSNYEPSPKKETMRAAHFDGRTYPVLYPASERLDGLPDGIMLQWPVHVSGTPVLPHMVQGDATHPVYLWHWRADWQGDDADHAVHEENVAGYRKPPRPQPPAAWQARARGTFEDGRWSVVIKRALHTKDAEDVQFRTGTLIPVAVNVWDGANEEFGLRRTISSWYFLLLQEPPTLAVYAMPVLGFSLILVLEFWAVRRVRKRSSPAVTKEEGGGKDD